MTQEVEIAEWFVAIDMDRTLIDTGFFASKLPELFGLSADEEEEFHRYEYTQRGQEFDAYGYLAEHHAHGIGELPGVDEFMALFPQPAELKSQLLLPGAEELLLALKDAEIAHGVWTKGSEANQLLKLSILRHLVDDPLLSAVVIPPEEHRSKACIIETEWYDPDPSRAAFLIPDNLHVYDGFVWTKRVILIDDKPTNLEHSGMTPIVTIEAVEGVLASLASQISTQGAEALSRYDQTPL